MKRLIFLLLFLPALSFGQVTKLVFTTEAQAIGVNEISAKITVSTQDDAGVLAPIASTAHLRLETSSPTGEFSSSASSWKPTAVLTMSKNTANRSFYYRDASAGRFTITVTAEDGQNWSAGSQEITIGSGEAQTEEPVNEEARAPESVGTRERGDLSAHSEAASLSRSEEKGISIGAGRNRLAAVGNPVEFQVVGGREGLNYLWSFGDGTEKAGRKAVHEYNFAGEYNVILTARGREEEAVARTKVRVIAPRLEIEPDIAGAYLRVSNNGTDEVNLYGFVLSCAERKTALPKNLIISAGQNVKLPLFLFGCAASSSNWVLESAGKSIAAYSRTEKIRALEKELLSLEQVLAARSSSLDDPEPVMEAIEEAAENKPPTVETIVLDEVKRESWWGRLRSVFR